MLIKCPECEKEISDKSKMCIHCGYPIAEVSKENIQLSESNCPLCESNSHILNGIKDTCSVCGYVFNFNECKEINPNIEIYPSTTQNTPHCPICNSTDLKRISSTAKAVNIAMFGLLGNKRKHQWHCNECKSDF